MRFKEFLKEQEAHILQLIKAVQFAFKDYDVEGYELDEYECKFLTVIALSSKCIEPDVERAQVLQALKSRAPQWIDDLKIKSGGEWDGLKYFITFSQMPSEEDTDKLISSLNDLLED